MNRQDVELLRLARDLKGAGYQFTTVTPETHTRLNRRANNRLAASLRDVFGWNRWFRREAGFERLVETLGAAGCLKQEGELFRSAVRFSTRGDLMFVHSGFPTVENDAVFFGPDSYRFAHCIERHLQDAAPNLTGDDTAILDIGAGTGCGGLLAAKCAKGRPPRVLLTDINPLALRFAQINVALNGVRAEVRESDVVDRVTEHFDLVVSNPPYMRDASARTYRHGGDRLGIDLSLRILKEGLGRLKDGGTLLLYTGAPVVDGIDQFWFAAGPCVADARFSVSYEELDPDVFGDQLEQPGYENSDRIAVVELKVRFG